MGILKEEIDAAGLQEAARGQCFSYIEKQLDTWAGEFKSKRNPTKEEIDDFYL